MDNQLKTSTISFVQIALTVRGMKVTVKTDRTTLQLEKGVWQDFATAQGSVGKQGLAQLALSRPDFFKAVMNVKVTSDVFFKEAAGLQFTTRLAAAQLKLLPTVRIRRIPASCIISRRII